MTPSPVQAPRKFPSISTILVTLVLLASVYVLVSAGSTTPISEVPISQIVRLYQDDKVASLKREAGVLTATMKDGSQLKANIDTFSDLSKDLGFDPAKVQIEVVDISKGRIWLELAGAIVPALLIVGFLIFMMRQAQSSNNNAMSFGKSKARLYSREREATTFDDVAGAHEAKEELLEIVDFLKHPKKYIAMGAKIPRGVMLFGPPGTGKTLLAKAVAGEAQVPFFSISGSEFVEMFVGVGASRVRDLFQRAKRNAPCIIFIDEIDAVGRQRGTGLGGGHDEREQTLNQILVEMDGFDTETNVIIMAATNRPDVLDPALLRPGRFDRRVVIDRPDLNDREAILKVHVRGKPLAQDVDLFRIAKITPGFSGADLQNLVNEAAIAAAKGGGKQIAMQDLLAAIEKVVMGPERKSLVLTKEEKEITAYHEAGHAIVSHTLPNSHPVHKISIISRGMSLGATWFLPEDDRHLASKAFFRDDLAASLGGRVAEQLIYGEERVTTGAANDIAKATELSRRMVTEYGMSRLGPVALTLHQGGAVFLGRELGEGRQHSEETARAIDAEVSAFLAEAQERAREVLVTRRDDLERIAQILLERETLDGEEFAKILAGGDAPVKPIRRTRKPSPRRR